MNGHFSGLEDELIGSGLSGFLSVNHQNNQEYLPSKGRHQSSAARLGWPTFVVGKGGSIISSGGSSWTLGGRLTPKWTRLTRRRLRSQGKDGIHYGIHLFCTLRWDLQVWMQHCRDPYGWCGQRTSYGLHTACKQWRWQHRNGIKERTSARYLSGEGIVAFY